MAWDRVKAALFGLVGAANPRVDYYALYRGTVLAQPRADRVSVKMDDPRIPGLSNIPLQVGLPGAVVAFSPGARVLIGWENGDPALPFACLWAGGETVAKVTINGAAVFLGGEVGAEPAVKGLSYRAAEDVLLAALAADFTAMAVLCTGPLAPLGPGFTAAATAITTFKATAAAAGSFLATSAKVL